MWGALSVIDFASWLRFPGAFELGHETTMTWNTSRSGWTHSMNAWSAWPRSSIVAQPEDRPGGEAGPIWHSAHPLRELNAASGATWRQGCRANNTAHWRPGGLFRSQPVAASLDAGCPQYRPTGKTALMDADCKPWRLATSIARARSHG